MEEKLVLNEKLWVPAHLVSPEILARFEHRPIVSYDRVSEWSEAKQLFVDKKVPVFATVNAYTLDNANLCYGFCRGDLRKIDKLFAKYEIDDQRSAPPMEHQITFTGTLKDYQEKAVEDFLEYESGQLKAAPRMGKTCCFVNMICKLGLKALILVHQDDLAEQAYSRFEEFTNFKEIEKSIGTGRLV